jgi:hypothetical protein
MNEISIPTSLLDKGYLINDVRMYVHIYECLRENETLITSIKGLASVLSWSEYRAKSALMRLQNPSNRKPLIDISWTVENNRVCIKKHKDSNKEKPAPLTDNKKTETVAERFLKVIEPHRMSSRRPRKDLVERGFNNAMRNQGIALEDINLVLDWIEKGSKNARILARTIISVSSFIAAFSSVYAIAVKELSGEDLW